MKTKKPETIVQRLRKHAFEPRSYSGRGMFGKSCVGVYIARGDEASVRDAERIVGAVATRDSLGRGTIAYWPSIEWPAGEDENHD